MDKAFGARLERELRAAKISQAAFAETVGVSQATISNICRLGRLPRIDVYERMLDALPVLCEPENKKPAAVSGAGPT